MHIERIRKYLHWLIPLTIVGSLFIFSATFLAYTAAHATDRVAGYAPAIAGLFVFAILMTAVSYFSLPGARSWARFFTAIGIAVLESAAFLVLLVLLLLRTFGS
jgi:hypothetical protein